MLCCASSGLLFVVWVGLVVVCGCGCGLVSSIYWSVYVVLCVIEWLCGFVFFM